MKTNKTNKNNNYVINNINDKNNKNDKNVNSVNIANVDNYVNSISKISKLSKMIVTVDLKLGHMSELLRHLTASDFSLTPEYHRPKGRPPKRYKSSIEENANKHNSSSSKKCSYCLDTGHNIRGCAKYKADKENTEANA